MNTEIQERVDFSGKKNASKEINKGIMLNNMAN